MRSRTTRAAVSNFDDSHSTSAELSSGRMYTSTHSDSRYVGTEKSTSAALSAASTCSLDFRFRQTAV